MAANPTPRRQEYSTGEIAQFWNEQPCLTGFISATEMDEILAEHDQYKHSNESHTAEKIASIDWQDRRVLEIGPGQGCEAEQIARAGARYSAIDLTSESIRRVGSRFERAGLRYEGLAMMNAESMAFPDSSFDMVFTHGVIHHSPRIEQIVKEIYRVLRPGGRMIAMVYHRDSLNYHVSIRFLRRTGVFLLRIPGMTGVISALTKEPPDRLAKHLHNLRKYGLQYLKMSNFIHRATDGPDNVYSAVFTEDEMRTLCASFRSITVSKHFLNERHFPIVRSMLTKTLKARLESRYGWHLWITATK